jgi:integrase
MSVRERAGSWQADFCHAGQRYRETFETKDEAERWETDARSRLSKGEQLVKPDRGSKPVGTMQQLLEATKGRYWSGSRNEDTAVKNGQDVVDALGSSTAPSSVTPAGVDSMIAGFRSQKLSDSTINRKLAALSKMLKYGERLGLVSKTIHIERLKEGQHRVRYLRLDEESGLLAHLRDQGEESFRDFIILLVDTGVRFDEGLSITWGWTADGLIQVQGKGGDNRAIPQSPRVKEMLEKRRKACPAGEEEVFWDVGYWPAQHKWQAVRKALGKEKDTQFVLHMCRHTFCSRLAQAGVPIQTIQRLAGHKTLAMTLRYAHLCPANFVDAIAKLPVPPEAVPSPNPMQLQTSASPLQKPSPKSVTRPSQATIQVA